MSSDCVSSRWIKAFVEVAESFKAQREPSIDGVIEDLVLHEHLVLIPGEEELQVCRTIVFAMLGWQTMLYQPSFHTSPPELLSVVDDFDGYQGQAFIAFKQKVVGAKNSLDDFLMGFGLVIPPKNTCISEDTEEKQAFETTSTVEPHELNAYVLESIAHVKIKWIDSMAAHLEYNKAMNTLYLFRYPSFCAANIPVNSEEAVARGVIHSCAAQADNAARWVSEDDITDFLREVLLSYRLLFGQTKRSRQSYRKNMRSNVLKEFPGQCDDPLLPLLCGRKSVDILVQEKERTVYRLSRDFPMLRFRLAVLKKQVAMSRPRGWKELWRDKRDSAQWVTFWAVIIIGGLGLLLSLLQVIVGILQVTGKTNVG